MSKIEPYKKGFDMLLADIEAHEAKPVSKIEPHDHPDFVGGIVWSRTEITWIEERLQQAVAHGIQMATAADKLDKLENVLSRQSDYSTLKEALAREKELRKALCRTAKCTSAAEVGLVVDENLATTRLDEMVLRND